MTTKNTEANRADYLAEMTEALNTPFLPGWARVFEREGLTGLGMPAEAQKNRIIQIGFSLSDEIIERIMLDIVWAVKTKNNPSLPQVKIPIGMMLQHLLLDEAEKRGMLRTSHEEEGRVLEPLQWRVEHTDALSITSPIDGINSDFVRSLSPIQFYAIAISFLGQVLSERQLGLLPPEDQALLRMPLPAELLADLEAKRLLSGGEEETDPARIAEAKARKKEHWVYRARTYCARYRLEQNRLAETVAEA